MAEVFLDTMSSLVVLCEGVTVESGSLSMLSHAASISLGLCMSSIISGKVGRMLHYIFSFVPCSVVGRPMYNGPCSDGMSSLF